MQIDNSSDENIASMYELISKSYKTFGYEPPHILFWNLRSTDGFPSLATQENVSMMSGFSPALLNAFCEKGMDALKDATPWNTMVDLLLNERYDPLAKIAETTV
jgi:ABC-type amino acid transport substrate-binding protein